MGPGRPDGIEGVTFEKSFSSAEFSKIKTLAFTVSAGEWRRQRPSYGRHSLTSSGSTSRTPVTRFQCFKHCNPFHRNLCSNKRPELVRTDVKKMLTVKAEESVVTLLIVFLIRLGGVPASVPSSLLCFPSSRRGSHLTNVGFDIIYTSIWFVTELNRRQKSWICDKRKGFSL